MPTSYHGQISMILEYISEIRPKSILDLGMGFGKYGVLCRELLDIPYERYARTLWQTRIDGVEGYKGYQNPIHKYVYDKVYYTTVQKAVKKLDSVYDLALMIDILEHFEKEEGRALLSEILRKCRKLLIAVPAIPCQQKYLDNTLEEHKSVWDVQDFVNFPIIKGCILPMGIYNNANIVVLLQGVS